MAPKESVLSNDLCLELGRVMAGSLDTASAGSVDCKLNDCAHEKLADLSSHGFEANSIPLEPQVLNEN